VGGGGVAVRDRWRGWKGQRCPIRCIERSNGSRSVKRHTASRDVCNRPPSIVAVVRRRRACKRVEAAAADRTVTTVT